MDTKDSAAAAVVGTYSARRVSAVMPELQPDILIASGPDMPQPCCECGFLSFYIYGDQVYCRMCAEKIQAMINRLREQD